jgi:RNA polymerase sigma-70 factor, ECF subfamily
VDEKLQFEEMYRAYGGAVRGFVHRRLPNGVADDVTADVFVAAWRRFDEAPVDPLPWLFAIARGVIANRRRSESRQLALEERLRSGLVPRLSWEPEARAMHADEFARAFSALREADREVLRLVAWEGLERGEAARVLAVTPAAFSVRLHRARRRLARALADSGHGQQGDIPTSMEVTE